MEEEKKHRRNFIKKVVVWAFLACFEKGIGRGKQMEDEEQKKKKFVKTERCFLGRKIVAERSPVCLRHLGSCAAEQEQLRGEKCLAVLVGRKKGTHDLLWPKDKKIIIK